MTEDKDTKWIEVQKKTFTRWMNTYLVERNMPIQDLQTDLQDGLVLINLLELISQHQFKTYNKRPKIINQKLENLNACLIFLKQEGLKLVNIGPEDLASGNLRLILGLIWTIILRYHIQKGREESAKNALLEWVRSKIPEYDVKDFTHSWEDGMALCALCNALRPDTVDMSQRSRDKPLENANVGADAAERDMNIPKVLQPEDMVAASDPLSCMTYISYFRDYDEKMRKAMSAEEARLAAERLERTPDPSKCSHNLPSTAEVNIPSDFVVTARNAAGRPIPQEPCDPRAHVPITVAVDITAPDGSKVTELEVVDNHNSTYGVTYTPRVEGKHQVTVTINEGPIKPAPATVNVLPPTPDPSKCTASGPGVEGAQAGEPCSFVVQARNRINDPIHVGGHPFKADVKGPFGENVPVTLVDNNDGTYTGTYDPAPGEHVVSVTLGNRPIQNSPYVVPITADAKLAFAGTSYAYGPGVEGPVNTFDPAVFYIQAVNPAGEKLDHGGDIFSVDVEDQRGFELSKVDVVDNHDGTYTCTYHAVEPGMYTVAVKLHHPKTPLYYAHIKASPIRVAVEPGLDPSKCVCFGPGLGKEVFDNKPTSFTVQTRDCNGKDIKDGGLPVEVAITGPNGEPVDAKVTDNGDGTYTVDYAPENKGDTEIKVTCKDKPLGESPYHVDVNAGADWEHTGIGSFSFVVQSRDKKGEIHRKGGETVAVSITTPSGAQVEGINVQDAGDGTYVASYSLPAESGDFAVSVSLNGHPIKGTPFTQHMP